MRLVLPLPPNMANSRRHWTAVFKQKKAYWAHCNVLKLALPKPPKEAPSRVRMKATLYLHSHMDDDNAMARLKHAVDWIVAQGYVTDDKRRNIEWAGLPDQVIDRKNPRLEIEIEPIAKEAAA